MDHSRNLYCNDGIFNRNIIKYGLSSHSSSSDVCSSDQFNLLSPFAMVFGIGLAANCAFMLPIATPPNALVYGTGFIEQKQMLKTGMVLNAFSIVVIFLLVSILL